MSKGFFVTGTDTGVGKTTIACHILTQLKMKGYRTAALKPLASGCKLDAEGFQNQDALLLQKAATLKTSYACVNPYALPLPIAPHIAAEKLGIELKINHIVNACDTLLTSSVDYIIIEGAGGFKVPLNIHETTADLAKAFGFPLILVVGLRLGCLNQSLLTHEAILKTGLPVAGWIGNVVENNMLAQEENINFLKKKFKAPFLGIFPQCFLEPLFG